MKIKKIAIAIALTILTILNSNKLFSQGTPVYDARADFNATMKKIEEKSFKAKDWFYSLQQIQVLINSFKRMDTIRRHTQAAYDLSYKIYDNTRKVSSLKDFGLNDVAYVAEKVIGMPVDPSYYLVRAKGTKYNKFVKAVSYRPSKKVDENSQDIYDFITAYDATSGASEGGNQIEIFDEIAKTFLFEDDWRKMVEMERAKKIAKFRCTIAEEIEKKKRAIIALQTDNKHSMSEMERISLINELNKEYYDLLDQLDKQNEQLANALNKKSRNIIKNAVAKEMHRRWYKHTIRVRNGKAIGEVSLRKYDKSHRPITKIEYDWK